MLKHQVQINGVVFEAGTSVDDLPADHVERLKRHGMIGQPKAAKETKPKQQDIETKD